MEPIRDGMQRLAGALGFGQGREAGAVESEGVVFAGDLVTLVNREFDRRQRERLPEELEWRENISFIEGQQFVSVNPQTQALEEMPLLYDYEEREAFNQIAPIIETRQARLTRGRPIRKVRPASNQSSDMAKAKTAAGLIRYTEQETRHRSLMGDLAAWVEYTGTAFKKSVWNPNKGRPILQVLGPDGQAGKTLREGAIDSVVVPPWEVYPDNLYAPFEEQRSIIHAKAYHVDTIEEQYGVKVQPENVDAITLQATQFGSRGLGYGKGGYRTTVGKLEKHALVKEFMERPSGKYPGGRFIVVAGGKLLYAGPMPFQVGQDSAPDIPLSAFYCLKRPGRFFGTCLVPRLKPLQRRYNAIRNREAERLSRGMIGQLQVEENSLVNMEEVEMNGTAPGQILLVKRGFTPPRYMEQPPLDPQIQVEKETILQEMRSLSGISDLAKQSQADPGLKSGIALSIALEQDDTRLSTTAGYIEEGLIIEAQQWLRLYRQFAKLPRIARITSAAEVEALQFSADDITSDDVVIEAGTGLAESPAQRRQFVLDLLGSGLLNDTETGRLTREGRAKVLELIEFGHWESAADSDYDLQRQKAQRNIKRIQAGMPVQVMPWDDSIVHVQEITRWMLTAEFEESDPRVQQLTVMLRDQHLAALQAQAMAQMQQQLAAQAAGVPGPGGPGGPGPARGINPRRMPERQPQPGQQPGLFT